MVDPVLTTSTAPTSAPPPPTLRDVAELAGVSMSTVSRVLTGKPGVAATTRTRIEGALRTLDYVSNLSARSLRGTRSMTYALLVDDLSSGFFSPLAESLTHIALDDGCTLLIVTTQKAYARERDIVSTMRARQVDGLFVVAATGDDAGERARRTLNLPVVYLERFPPGADVDVVTFDYHRAGLAQIEELWDRGHRRIAFVGGNVIEDPGSRRLAAYRDGLRAHGVEPDPKLISVLHETGVDDRATADASVRSALEGLMATSSPPTAVVVTVAPLLRTILALCAENGWELAVASYESFDIPVLTPVPLVVTHGDLDELARTAASLLRSRIEQGPGEPRTVLLETRTDVFLPL